MAADEAWLARTALTGGDGARAVPVLKCGCRTAANWNPDEPRGCRVPAARAASGQLRWAAGS